MLPDSADFLQNVHTGTLTSHFNFSVKKKIPYKLEKQVIFGIFASFLEIFEKKCLHSDHCALCLEGHKSNDLIQT